MRGAQFLRITMPRRRRSSPYRHHSHHHHHHQSGEHGSDGDQNPPQRNAANARERARMRVLSRAFCRLKTTLPWVPADTKLSKLDTLRLATSYIAHLRAALAADQPVDDINGTITTMTHHPLNLTWPFTFQHGVNHNGSCRVAAPPSPQGGGADSECSSSSPISDLGPLCTESNIGHPDFSPFMYHDDGYINHNHDTWQCR